MSMNQAQVIHEHLLLVPPLSRLEQSRSALIDVIKSRAIRMLHLSQAGEIRLLQMYFLAETATVHGIAQDIGQLEQPEWLWAFHRQHAIEEGEHIKLFRDAIKARGGQIPKARQLDWLSQHKVKQWMAIAEIWRGRFAQDALVPAYAIGLCAEQMGVRVLQRHCRAINAQNPLYALFNQVLADEARHVQGCAEVLNKLVPEAEQLELQRLLRAIRKVDRSWGMSTAFALLFAACWYRLQAGLLRAS